MIRSGGNTTVRIIKNIYHKYFPCKNHKWKYYKRGCFTNYNVYECIKCGKQKPSEWDSKKMTHEELDRFEKIYLPKI